jgi:nicotinamidase-related amidase
MRIQGAPLARLAIGIAACMVFGAAGERAFAADVIESWNQAGQPTAPTLKPVTAEAKQTALLLLDFNTNMCSMEKRQRCFQSLPKVAAVLKAARSAGVMVIYSIVRDGTLATVPSQIAANPGDLTVPSFGADKFYGTDLEQMLKNKNIHNLVLVGTSAQGAVLYTSGGAALRGLNVIVPVDTASSDTLYGELAATWVLANGPSSVSGHVTLTRSDLLHF